jgi:hypothetical protein
MRAAPPQARGEAPTTQWSPALTWLPIALTTTASACELGCFEAPRTEQWPDRWFSSKKQGQFCLRKKNPAPTSPAPRKGTTLVGRLLRLPLRPYNYPLPTFFFGWPTSASRIRRTSSVLPNAEGHLARPTWIRSKRRHAQASLEWVAEEKRT